VGAGVLIASGVRLRHADRNLAGQTS
jgi:hypothetical protein